MATYDAFKDSASALSRGATNNILEPTRCAQPEGRTMTSVARPRLSCFGVFRTSATNWRIPCNVVCNKCGWGP
eukprot:3659566-Amphidinium_carterae.1